MFGLQNNFDSICDGIQRLSDSVYSKQEHFDRKFDLIGYEDDKLGYRVSQFTSRLCLAEWESALVLMGQMTALREAHIRVQSRAEEISSLCSVCETAIKDIRVKINEREGTLNRLSTTLDAERFQLDQLLNERSELEKEHPFAGSLYHALHHQRELLTLVEKAQTKHFNRSHTMLKPYIFALMYKDAVELKGHYIDGDICDEGFFVHFLDAGVLRDCEKLDDCRDLFGTRPYISCQDHRDKSDSGILTRKENQALNIQQKAVEDCDFYKAVEGAIDRLCEKVYIILNQHPRY